MYKITKIINNNIVCSLDSDGKEIIIRGLGIGFKSKVNDFIEDDKIEKVYKIANEKTSNKLIELLQDIPLEYITLSTEIIEYARKALNKRLNDNIYISLTDHISFAIDRKKSGLEYKNFLHLEIKRFYPQEYQVGLHALEVIKEKLKVELSQDEAAFIALHILNAQLDTGISNMVKITEMIQGIIVLVEEYYQKTLDTESLHYERFITHLKFFGQRLFNNKRSDQKDEAFHNIVKERFLKDYRCAEKIRNYIVDKYHITITEEEMMFLTIHLRKISEI